MEENTNAERSSRAEDLSGLPAKEREETEKILSEIDAEAPKPEEKPVDGKEPDGKKPEEVADAAAADGKKPEGEAGSDQAGKDEKRREAGLMPKWVHEAYKDKTEKQLKALQADLTTAAGRAPANGTEGNGDSKQDAKTDDEFEKEAKAIAEKHGITADLAKDLLEAAGRRNQLSPEAQSKLKDIDDLKAAREVEVETAQFNADFDRTIIPLVKVEYGDDVPPETVAKIKDELKQLAYDPEGTYGKVPYTTIYKGVDQFRDLIPAAKRGPESSRGGATANAGAAGDSSKPDLTKPLSDDIVRTLSGDDFDTYSKNMETAEKAKSRKS